MTLLLNDLRFAIRFYAKRPGLLITVILILSLGIGITAAVFSVVDAVLLKPLPYPHAERIVLPLRQTPPGVNIGYREIPWGVPSFHALEQRTHSFQTLGAFKSDSFNLTGSGRPSLLTGFRVSSGFFPSLGTEPKLGRWFTADEDQIGHEHEVILSDRLWHDRFGGSNSILGTTLDLNGTPYLVVGVMPAAFVFPRGEEMPAGFDFPRKAELWVPLAAPATSLPDASDDLAVIARLRADVSYPQAQTDMDQLSASMESEFKAPGWFTAKITPLEQQVSGDVKKPLLLTLGAVFVVLFIVCLNIANLLLVSSIERRTEFTLRAAIGAGRGRLIRQLLTENLFLAVVGGIGGVLFAFAGTYLIRMLGPVNIPRLQEVSLDIRVLIFILIVTALCGLFFGAAPILSIGRGSLSEALNERGIGSMRGAVSAKIRGFLTVTEVALALVLMIAACLLTETFLHLLHTDGGFNPARVLTFELSLPDSKYSDVDKIVSLYQSVLQVLPNVPGVSSAGVVRTVPLTGVTEGSGIRIPGFVAKSKRDRIVANYNVASPGYFAAIGTPLLQGRDFSDGDTAGSLPVVIINSAMARKFWPAQDSLGKQVGLGSPRFPLMSIIGVVADVKHISLRDDPGPEMYVPLTQKPYPSMSIMSVVLRTKIAPMAVATDVERAIHSVDPDLPIANMTTLEAIREDSTAQARFSMLVLASFGGLALLLACIGMYGVISYSAMQRTQEIGVRMAFGASRSSVFRMVLGEAARLAGIGAVLGIVTALVLTRLMQSFLYGVQANDWLTFVLVFFALTGMVLLASYLPSRRATQVDPMVALRYK